MKKMKKCLFYCYVAVVLCLIGIAAYGHLAEGMTEYAISSHLYLTVLSFPSGWVSWMLPHGSMVAVLCAGSLGIVQWYYLGIKYGLFKT